MGLGIRGLHIKEMEKPTRALLDVYKTHWLSQRWIFELIKKLLGIMLVMWQNQNKALNKTNDNKPRILMAEINQKVTELYALGPSAFVSSNTLFKHLLSDLLQLPHAYKRHWMDTAIIAKAWQDRRRKAGSY